MFIQTEPTPNPSTLKFLPGQQVMERGSIDFATADRAKDSPLATSLFAIEGVDAVFFGIDFITVAKQADANWQVLKPQILAAIMDHYTSGQPLLTGEQAAVSDEEDSEIVAQIKELLETRVRPAVANDGGDIIFRAFEDGVVYLHLQGSCAGCPSSTATLKHGIENMLRYYIPEVQAVEAIN